jgi:hypothetical protein
VRTRGLHHSGRASQGVSRANHCANRHKAQVANLRQDTEDAYTMLGDDPDAGHISPRYLPTYDYSLSAYLLTSFFCQIHPTQVETANFPEAPRHRAVTWSVERRLNRSSGDRRGFTVPIL